MPPHAVAQRLSRETARPYHEVRRAWNRLVAYDWTHEDAEKFIRDSAALGQNVEDAADAAIAAANSHSESQR